MQENPVGEKFDPNKHDALFQVFQFYFKLLKLGFNVYSQIPSPDKEPNTVLDVQKVK